MTSPRDRYLAPSYPSPKSPYQTPNIPKGAATSTSMARSSSYDPHRVLGYFDIPSRSAPSSPQMSSYLPYSPVSRSSSPARDTRKSREYTHSHSGSDFEDSLVGFSLAPNWLKLAMEQDQLPTSSAPNRTKPYSPLSSPNYAPSTSEQNTPVTPRTPHLNVDIPNPKTELLSSPQLSRRGSKQKRQADEDRRYWDEEEDDGYFGEMEIGEDEDLEEAYRSIY